jgi:hypothetical protein
MLIEEVRLYLDTVARRPLEPSSEAVKKALAAIKSEAVSRGDQTEAKVVWCLEQALRAQDSYFAAFQALKGKKFYEAWCEFEHVELTLHDLSRHDTSSWSRFKLDHIQRYTEKWQRLFPYKLFLSPELLELEKKCSICGQIVNPRKQCGHITGEIYDGQMCLRIVTKMEPLGVAMVEKPVQKYSVIFLSDQVTGQSRDHYNYALVQYAINALREPFDEWDVEQTSKLWPHSRFSHIGRNDPCPCESGRKYKKCCWPRDGVVLPHWQFRFAVAPPEGTPAEWLASSEQKKSKTE